MHVLEIAEVNTVFVLGEVLSVVFSKYFSTHFLLSVESVLVYYIHCGISRGYLRSIDQNLVFGLADDFDDLTV